MVADWSTSRAFSWPTEQSLEFFLGETFFFLSDSVVSKWSMGLSVCLVLFLVPNPSLSLFLSLSVWLSVSLSLSLLSSPLSVFCLQPFSSDFSK